LLCADAGGYPFTGLLPTGQGVVPEWNQPNRQYREGLLARPTPATAHPNAFVTIIVRRAEPLSMADDGHALAQWASSG